MELYFIRHGQSENNANWQDPEYVENPDPELTDKGHEQAKILANYIKDNFIIPEPAGWDIQNRHGFGITHIYTSLMVRAASTAAPIARATGAPFSAWVETHEKGGIFKHAADSSLEGLPGKPRSFFEKNFPEMRLPDQLDESGWWNRPFETIDERQPRANKFLTDLLSRHGNKEGQPIQRVALISHGGFFNHLLCAMLNIPWQQIADDFNPWFLLNNCSISRFDLDNTNTRICYLNRTDYLPDHLIT